MAQRSYHVGDERFLYLGSGGFCYYPKCNAPVLREIEGEMISQVEIAHIHALEKGGSRYVGDMTKEQLNSHTNLILLCIPHHKIVDRKSNEPKYPAAQLFQWKRDREGAKLDALGGLGHLTKEEFDLLLVDSVNSAKNELLDAIDALPEQIDKRIVRTLKQLIERSFRQPKLDIDAVDSFSNATWKLHRMSFPDTVEHFSRVVTKLERVSRNLPEY